MQEGHGLVDIDHHWRETLGLLLPEGADGGQHVDHLCTVCWVKEGRVHHPVTRREEAVIHRFLRPRGEKMTQVATPHLDHL